MERHTKGLHAGTGSGDLGHGSPGSPPAPLRPRCTRGCPGGVWATCPVLTALGQASRGISVPPTHPTRKGQVPRQPLPPRPSPVALRGHRTAATSPAGVSFQTTVPKLSSSQISWGSDKGQRHESGQGRGNAGRGRELAAGSGGPRRHRISTLTKRSSPSCAPSASPATQGPAVGWGGDTHRDTAGRHTAGIRPGGPGRPLPQRRAPSRCAPAAVCHPRT